MLGIPAIIVPWDTLLTSVVLYIVILVVIAQLWRKALLAKGQGAFDAAMEKIGPWSITALLATLLLLLAFQGEAILRQPLIIGLRGFESGAALATVVGVLIEVQAMLLVVKGWYEAG